MKATKNEGHVARRIAFFDVDETLIAGKSMFSFLRLFYLRRYGNFGKYMYAFFMLRVKWLVKFGASREAINSTYYSVFRGVDVLQLTNAGLYWYEQQIKKGGFYVEDVIGELKQLKQDGFLVTLVSGSFHPCLDPIAEHLNANHVLCTELECRDGILTGRLLQQTIGSGKAGAIQKLLEELNVDASVCTAYGDHISDLFMLELVGAPIVVGRHSSQLVEIAERRGWPIRDVCAIH
ncbi:MAG TPA: HAD-IB family hydrolase [Thiomonas arsenitoxydans]|uniref:HAD family hydrolase n=1 Tax=Thiomonas arsenitoxydans (strain DSM 22701 / CIP 110005 / 3As) TaxID=426114 RepID=UPI002C99685B|nr:HAD-IB family hydrolase [Thiomonas arsenitoxydans]HML83233.1 HAD-IB family hydrolase [Thiomonas arsenitoxydans]